MGIWDTHEYSNVRLKLNPRPRLIPKHTTELMDTTHLGTPTNNPLIPPLILVILLIPMDTPPLTLPPSSTTSTDSSNVTLKLNPKPMLKPIPKHTTELTDTTQAGTTPTGICLLTPDMLPNLTVITVILPPTTTTTTTV